MNPEEHQHFEDLIVKAVQAGKQETSGLVDMILHKLENHIEVSINKNVNGKLDKMNAKIDNYIFDDNEWKQKAEPVIMMGRNVQGFGKVSLYIVGFVAAVAGAFISLANLFKNE